MVKCWKQMAKFRESFTFIDRKGIQLSVLTCPKPSAKTKKQQFLELRPDERGRPPLFISFDSFCPDLTHQGRQTICYSVKQQNDSFGPFYLYWASNPGSRCGHLRLSWENRHYSLYEYWICVESKAHKILIFMGRLKIQGIVRIKRHLCLIYKFHLPVQPIDHVVLRK